MSDGLDSDLFGPAPADDPDESMLIRCFERAVRGEGTATAWRTEGLLLDRHRQTHTPVSIALHACVQVFM